MSFTAVSSWTEEVIYWFALGVAFFVYSRVYHQRYFKVEPPIAGGLPPVGVTAVETAPVFPSSAGTIPAVRRVSAAATREAEIRALLNKVCPDGFGSLADRILCIVRESGCAVAEPVVALVFASAVSAPAYLPLYGKIMAFIAEEFPEVRPHILRIGRNLIDNYQGTPQPLTVVCRFMGLLTGIGVVYESEMQAVLDMLLASPTQCACIEGAICATVTMGTSGTSQPFLDEAFARLQFVKANVPMRLKFLIEDAVELRSGNFRKQHRVLNTQPAGKRAEYSRSPEDPAVHMPPSDKPFASMQFVTDAGRRSHRFESLRLTAQHALQHGAPLTVLSGTLNVDRVVEAMISIGHTVAVIKPGMSEECRRATVQRWDRERATCLVSTHEVSPRSYSNKRKGAYVCVFDFPKSWCMFWPWVRKLGIENAHVTTLLTTECDRRPAAVLCAWLQRTGRDAPKAVVAMQRSARG